MLNTISRLLAVIVAGVEVITVYSRDDAFSTEGVPHIPIVVTGPLVVAGPLILIWFGDSIADFEADHGRWCPPIFVKFAGWVFLLAIGLFLIWGRKCSQ